MKKIKELWNRFRRWLIVKLGGYLKGPHIIKTTTQPVIRICGAMKAVDRDLYNSDDKFKEHIERGLVDQMADYIYAHRDTLVEMEVTESYYDTTPGLDFRTEIKIAVVK